MNKWLVVSSTKNNSILKYGFPTRDKARRVKNEFATLPRFTSVRVVKGK